MSLKDVPVRARLWAPRQVGWKFPSSDLYFPFPILSAPPRHHIVTNAALSVPFVGAEHLNDMTGGNRAVVSTIGFFKKN